jgi:hypothetical protein
MVSFRATDCTVKKRIEVSGDNLLVFRQDIDTHQILEGGRDFGTSFYKDQQRQSESRRYAKFEEN